MSTASTLVGNDTKPIPLVLVCVAFERLQGPLTVVARTLVATNGMHVDSSSGLMQAFAIPGVIIKDPLAEGDTPGVVTAATVGRFDSMRSIDDVSDLVGGNTVAFCHALADLWDKVKGTPFFTEYQIDRCRAACLLGMLCFPTSGKEVLNFLPTTPPALAVPPVTDATRAGYDEIVKRFKVARSAYYSKQFTAAIAAAKASAADVAFWDSVYVVVKSVADAPKEIVGAVGDATLGFVGGFLARTWYLFAIAGVIAFAWLNRGTLAHAANEKVLKVLKVSHAPE